MGTSFVRETRRLVFVGGRLAGSLALAAMIGGLAVAQTTPAKSPPVVGTVKSIDNGTMTITTDAGAQSKVTVSPTTRLVSVPPGSKDLSQAVEIPITEFQPGDRVLASVRCTGDPPVCEAVRVVAMKKAEIADKQAQEREAWRRGIGGLVRSADTGAGTITISTVTAAGKKDVAVSIGQNAVVRRYAPGSVKFDDAKPSSVSEIQPGDQLRARGVRGADGATFTADEIVTGSFLNISGTVSAVDAGAGTLSVTDLATKKTQVVKVSPDTQLRKLPANMAQMIAARLKGGGPAPGQGAAAAGGGSGGTASGGAQGGGAGQGQGQGQGQNQGQGQGRGGGDFQTVLSRLPASTLGDFQKGDAVMIVATGAQKDAQATAITVVGGVEPLLQSTTQEQASTILSPWSLSGGGGGDAAAQ
jgi:hypothetical protein